MTSLDQALRAVADARSKIAVTRKAEADERAGAAQADVKAKAKRAQMEKARTDSARRGAERDALASEKESDRRTRAANGHKATLRKLGVTLRTAGRSVASAADTEARRLH